jgi:hypothetical protein
MTGHPKWPERPIVTGCLTTSAASLAKIAR